MGCVMAWIEGTGPPGLPDIFQVLSINPEALDTVKQLNETLSFGNSPLGRVREEAIATVVAVANRCRFGALTHGGFLRQYTGDQLTAANMLVNHHLAGLEPADRKMLDFAVQATLKPSTMTRDDVESLRQVGFDDQEILSIILVTCLVNFMNRLADSLGIDIPPSYQKAVEQWLTGPAGRQPWLMRPVSQRARNPGEVPLQGTLGPNGWSASPDWHNQDDGGVDGLAGPVFGDSPVGDSGSLDLDGAAGEELPDFHLDGPENGVNLDELKDLLAAEDPSVPTASDALYLGASAENDEPGRGLEAPEDSGTAGLTLDEGDQAGLESQLAASPTDPGGQPPAGPDDIEQVNPTTSPDALGFQEEPGIEAASDDQEEEDVVSVDPINPVARFIGDLCVVEDGEVSSARDLYIAYLRWCDDNVEPPMPQRGFGMMLTEMGFQRRRRGRGRNWSWWGVRLAAGDTGRVDKDLGFDSGVRRFR